MENEPTLEDLLNVLKTSGYPERLCNAVEKIKDAAKSIEKTILDGAEFDVKEVCNKVCSVFIQYCSEAKEFSLYETSILEWSMNELKKIGTDAMKQRKLFEFYETTSNQPDYTMWSMPEKPNAKVFIKEGDEFYMRTMEFPNLKMGQYDEIDFIDIDCEAVITESKREPWKKNYKRLADIIQEEAKAYSVMLVRYSKAVSDNEIRHMASIFLARFALHKRDQQKNA
ncbi:hypothetical protein HYU07_01150 [Candidatus Woesearchaeota archaeon]|nr:hypothetical protein [Candidatus Woesearchaeota archaeon]